MSFGFRRKKQEARNKKQEERGKKQEFFKYKKTFACLAKVGLWYRVIEVGLSHGSVYNVFIVFFIEGV